MRNCERMELGSGKSLKVKTATFSRLQQRSPVVNQCIRFAFLICSLVSSLKCACASELPEGLVKTLIVEPHPRVCNNMSWGGS